MDLHILNTGDRYEAVEAGVNPAILRLLQPLLHQGGNLPSPYQDFRLDLVRKNEWAMFTLWRAKEPITLTGAACTHQGATGLWKHLENIYYELSDQYLDWMEAGCVPQKPESLPWLATIYLPAYQIAARGQVDWIRDFTRCFGTATIADMTVVASRASPRGV